MKILKVLLLSAMLLNLGTPVQAQSDSSELTARTPQDSTTTQKADSTKKGRVISLDVNGIYIGSKKPDSAKNEKFLVQWGMVDLGFNRIDDKTNYSNSSGAFNSLYGIGTDPNALYEAPSSAPFKLNEGKSINVNVWIANTRLRLADGENQKLFFTSGIGLQMYNFRFDSRIMYKADPNTHLETIASDLDIQKNKLGFTYAAIPVGLLAKTRITPKRWLVYGASITGGYRLASWTKLKTAQNGKDKNHDPFNFSDFNACVMAEVGIDDVIRLYGSYQLTPLSSGPLNQHPFAIGVRFFGL